MVRIHVPQCFLSLLLPLILLTGCGGQGGFDLSEHASRMPARRLEIRQLGQTPLRIPADEPFNIHEPLSQQADNAKGDASANPSGTAICRAEAHGLGSADAQFQLGHKFDLAADTPFSAVIKINSEGTVRRSISDDDPDSVAQVDLSVFVRDSRGGVLRKETILTGDHSSIQGVFHRLTQFEVMLEPDRGYYVVLAGKVTASAGAKSRTAAVIDITSVNLEVAANTDASTRPAATQGSRP